MSCLNTQQQSRPSFDLTRFWQEEIANTQSLEANFKTHPLPLARIKKVMKSDPEVKMISAEAPILFAKACEVFITELTKRAWVHAEESKRRTLLRSDIAMGISKTDMCDFLIDIVPRTEAIAAETSKQSATANEPFTYHPESGQFDSAASASSEKVELCMDTQV
ncbi:histone-fold-containing protein [Fennellomyces sp. T-0311]|nr:histone-fold-containing protein [Fennellomyces sp. T-0311]